MKHILALPLVAKAIGFAVLVGVALWGSLKHKAVSEVSGAAIKAVESKVLVWFAKKLYAAAPPLTAALAPTQSTMK